MTFLLKPKKQKLKVRMHAFRTFTHNLQRVLLKICSTAISKSFDRAECHFESLPPAARSTAVGEFSRGLGPALKATDLILQRGKEAAIVLRVWWWRKCIWEFVERMAEEVASFAEDMIKSIGAGES